MLTEIRDAEDRERAGTAAKAKPIESSVATVAAHQITNGLGSRGAEWPGFQAHRSRREPLTSGQRTPTSSPWSGLAPLREGGDRRARIAGSGGGRRVISGQPDPQVLTIPPSRFSHLSFPITKT